MDYTTKQERLHKPLPLWVRDLLSGARIALGVSVGIIFIWSFIVLVSLAFN